MKEIREILKAFERAQQLGLESALATVVKVDGSSYRRPGARMLIREDGVFTGAISGGCLEGDALKKASIALATGKNKLVVYDSTNEDEAQFGVQLGCNGRVYLLLEPILDQNSGLIDLLREAVSTRHTKLLLTRFSFDSDALPAGTCALFDESGNLLYRIGNTLIPKDISEGRIATAQGEECWVERLLPPVALHIYGAGNDAQPLAGFAQGLGWDVQVFDGRPETLSVSRFPTALSRTLFRPDRSEGLDQWQDPYTAYVLMSHNYPYDRAVLSLLLKQRKSGYIACLGPRKRLSRMLSELESEGLYLDPEQRNQLHGPAGLNLGAEGPEEIALSIVAEILAFFNHKPGGSLRNLKTNIHEFT